MAKLVCRMRSADIAPRSVVSTARIARIVDQVALVEDDQVGAERLVQRKLGVGEVEVPKIVGIDQTEDAIDDEAISDLLALERIDDRERARDAARLDDEPVRRRLALQQAPRRADQVVPN